MPSMTAAKSDLIRSSFQAVMSTRPELVEDFYTRLFVIAPEIRKVLPKSREAQSAHLESMLQLALSALDTQDALVGSLHAMGQNYAKVGITAGQHQMINEALMDTLADQIGDDWTAEISAAWSSVLSFISAHMIDGVQSAPKYTHPSAA